MTSAVDLNPYFAGNFGPVSEGPDGDACHYRGDPAWTDRSLLRNGPTPVLAPDPGKYHWFIGDGMLHGIELSEGLAQYRNRWVRTPKACDAVGRTGTKRGAGSQRDRFSCQHQRRPSRRPHPCFGRVQSADPRQVRSVDGGCFRFRWPTDGTIHGPPEVRSDDR